MMNKHILTVMVALALIIGYNTIIVSNYAVASVSLPIRISIIIDRIIDKGDIMQVEK
jgi:hypothetical protein